LKKSEDGEKMYIILCSYSYIYKKVALFVKAQALVLEVLGTSLDVSELSKIRYLLRFVHQQGSNLTIELVN